MEGEESSKTFPMGETAQERGLAHVSKSYMISPVDRPSQNPQTANVPVVDLAGLVDPAKRPSVVNEIKNACLRHGFFQIINHGIPQCILDGALSTALSFFNLPNEEKVKFMSNDVHKPVRYGTTSLKDGVDKVQPLRVLLKHYAHPLKDWIEQWPANPPEYRDNMGEYAVKVRKLAMELMGAITESLGIGPKYLEDKMEEGMQVMGVNWYTPCPQPSPALGLPPHSDHGCLSIVLHCSPGLEILDTSDDTWRLVLDIKGALQVIVGDHLEVLSNGSYKSVVHRVTLTSERTRISIASFHSLGLDEKMETAKELVDEAHPKGYKESSFRDFLNFLSKNDTADAKSYIDTLKIH